MQRSNVERALSDAEQDSHPKETSRGATRPDGFSWVAATASAVSAIAVVLVLLGYGTSLAVESRFGLPHALMFESVLKLTHFASTPVSTLLSLGPTTLLTWQGFLDFYAQNGVLVLGGMAAWLVVTLGVYLYVKKKQPVRSRTVTTGDGKQGRQTKPGQADVPRTRLSLASDADPNVWHRGWHRFARRRDRHGSSRRHAWSGAQLR